MKTLADYPATATKAERAQLSAAQSRMLHRLERRNYFERSRHGEEWIEQGELVMDFAMEYDGGLAWRTADRVFGAIARRGLVERCADADDLVRVSDAGLALMGLQR